ncbi:glycosyltransferase [uncultured Aeromicrobium sp.]|uniref:glycosyltransferase n=1 Tax=uncultured Aeromicrobium sp. TaxID=337820 RepID=UPI0025D10CD8|nr:glycosyltransferase [uncultured Aeromicrobium sp.]
MTVLAHVVPGPTDDRDLSALYVDRTGAPQRVSYATYFNAFPAGYWSKWTNVEQVTLTVQTQGEGVLEVFTSDASSQSRVTHSETLSGHHTTRVDLSLRGHDDGGWFWFDLLPADVDAPVELVEATWSTDSAPRTQGKASVGITTFNKPDYCVDTLRALADAPTALSVLDAIYLVDQGTAKVADQRGYDEAARQLASQLRVIDQANLGGSGGFSRAMLETLDAGTSAFTLLLDDDVMIEPEAIYRIVQFGRFATRPTIVGGHMFDLLNPSVLHAWAEILDLRYFMWRPGPPAHSRHNFRERNLRATPWTHRRDDADYTGWWMCLIPVEAIKRIGLSLPVFIKWDDAEYSVRARAIDVPTVSLPGSALWHVSWVDKDDSRDWQAYFHARNRLIAALVHSDYPSGGRLFSNLSRIDVKHLLCMEYYAAHLRERAYRDVLRGPEHLHEEIGTILGELTAERSRFVENQMYNAPQEIPSSREGRLTFDIDLDEQPPRALLPAFTARHFMHHWTAPSEPNDVAPQVELVRRDATWWRMPRYESALVTDAQRTSAVIYRRDRELFRSQFRRNRAALHEVEKNWNRLARDYRSAMADITSPEAWRKTLGLAS